MTSLLEDRGARDKQVDDDAMTGGDEFGIDDDDFAFITAATQAEASQHVESFEQSERPHKRRRVGHGIDQLEDASIGEPSSGTDVILSSKQGVHLKCNASIRAPQDEDHDNEPDTDEEYYFPGEINGIGAEKSAPKSKYKIHIPQHGGGQIPDKIFTQTQANLDSSPGRIRGAIWKRPRPQVPTFSQQENVDPKHQATGKTGTTGMRPGQTLLNGANGFTRALSTTRSETDAQLAARLQAEENALHGLSGPRPNARFAKLPSFDASNELADLPSDAFSSSAPEGLPSKDVVTISSQPVVLQAHSRGLRGPQTGLKQMTIFGQPATQDFSASQAAKKKHAWPLKSRDEAPTHHKLDSKALETWVYPTNLGTTRDYQFNIVARSLFHNTLVALPTGLGKTFIAATVMLNYYRWTSNAQIVFMAPTKPLIAQQMEACFHIVGISRNDTVLMTGESSPGIRAEEWLQRRVFFMTPQTVINDLKTGICDPKRIVLLVVDEAHKATGSYAYTEVVSFMRRFNPSFRVLALTATPGSTVEAVQAVIDHLGIARVELRTEQSIDIRQYTHEKDTQTEVFQYNADQTTIMDLMSKALRPVLEKLNSQNAYWARDPMQLSAFGLTQARGKWMSSDAGRKAPQAIKGMVNAIFTVLASLAHSIGLLKNHGIVPFYSGVVEFQKNVDSGQSKGKNAQQIAQCESFTKMMSTIRGWTNNPDYIGHPKLEYLREVVLNHFLDAGEGRQGGDVPPSATRVMVFATYRDSTEEICRVLKRNDPMIRPHVFVGQASSSSSEGMNQKKQNEVIQDFKSGKYNTLVATSIGEEGLDIGDVDLIVCYDASSSPIRMLQRIGRTGRKRVGKVVLLLMSGKEEADYAKAQDNYAFIQKTIADTSKYNYHEEQSPRIVPKEVQPIVDKRIIDIPVENSQPIDLNEKGRRAKGKPKKRPPKKFHMPDNVRTGFVKASKLDSDASDSERPVPKKTTAARKTPAKGKKVALPPEPEIVQLPFLGDVLLSAAQESELELKYAHIADNDAELVVRPPDATRHLNSLRQLGPAKYVKHGRGALIVSKAMRALHEVDDIRVQQMKELLDHSDLLNTGAARIRLVSPDPALDESDDALPSLPPQATQSAKTPRTKARKKPAAKQPLRRIASTGSAAMEGEESEPEPTAANMRIGTQGIDLGSRDTSGEDNDDEADSELEAFVARSDEVIEAMSSSLPGTMEIAREARRPVGRGRGSVAELLSSDATVLGEGDERSVAEMSGEETERNAPNGVGRATIRNRRVVDESDSE